MCSTDGSELVFNPSGGLVNSYSDYFLPIFLSTDSSGDIYSSGIIYGTGLRKCAGCASGTGTDVSLVNDGREYGSSIADPYGNLFVMTTINGSAAIEKFDATTGQDLGTLLTANYLYPHHIAYTSYTYSSAAPEPSTTMLAGVGSILLIEVMRRRNKRNQRF